MPDIENRSETQQIEKLAVRLADLEQRYRETEVQLRNRQRLDSLGTLAQGMAHDFNNILSGIMAYLNILSLTSDNFSTAQKTYVQNIINSVKRGAARIKQFQSLSDDRKVPKTCVDVFSVAKEVFDILEKTTDRVIEKNLDLLPEKFFIQADANEIHQVFMNLGTNAIHAIEEKGAAKGDYIKLRAAADEMLAEQADGLELKNYFGFCFEDTGKGMAESVARKAFEPLFSTRKEASTPGQGLGLAMVQDIVCKSHGGHIRIESEEGNGCRIWLSLPKADAIDLDEIKESVIYGGTETILVVDDDQAVRESIATALEDFGYQVLCAEDGEKGLSVFKNYREKIHAVLLDIVMPNMPGNEVLREMLKIDPDVKVIISSGHMADQYADSIIQSAKNFLKKPFELDELDATLRQVLDLKP